MEQIGKILASTKSGAGGRKAILCVGGGILVVLAMCNRTEAVREIQSRIRGGK